MDLVDWSVAMQFGVAAVAAGRVGHAGAAPGMRIVQQPRKMHFCQEDDIRASSNSKRHELKPFHPMESGPKMTWLDTKDARGGARVKSLRAGQGKILRGGACEGENFAFVCEIWDQLMFSTVFASPKKLFAKGRGKKNWEKARGFKAQQHGVSRGSNNPPSLSTKW